MTQIAQLSEAEIENRFQVSGARPVAFMLAGFAKDRDQFSVQFEGQVFLTTLLAVDVDKARLIIDCSGSNDLNRRFREANRATFVGRPGGIHVQFSTGGPQEINYQGGKAFSVALPKFLVRMQRRDSFRIETPRARPLELFGYLPDGKLVKLPVHDISVAGLGVTVPEVPQDLVAGIALKNCHLQLPEESKDLFFNATVAHMTEYEGRLGAKNWRVGLHFVDLPSGEEARIQRYIARVERERHELS
jgi:c-di-GMP-binding flagellar brake protein YcgR